MLLGWSRLGYQHTAAPRAVAVEFGVTEGRRAVRRALSYPDRSIPIRVPAGSTTEGRITPCEVTR